MMSLRLGVRRHGRFLPAAATAIAVALPGMAASQDFQDSALVRRLAELGKLCSAARFLHPGLAYRPIDWDSALVAAIPRVIEVPRNPRRSE